MRGGNEVSRAPLRNRRLSMNKRLFLLLILFVPACAVGPDYVRPASELPEKWDAPSAAAPDLSAWWLRFDDPRLVALIDESLAHNRDIAVAAANVEAAAAALRLARADYLPTVNATVGANRASPGESGALPAPPAPYTEYRAGLAVSYELDIWGRIRRAN